MKPASPERLLARTFFRRLFESELLPPGLPQVQIVIWGIALVAAPGHLMSVGRAIRYDQMAKLRPASLPEMILLDEFVFVTVAMMAAGFVALMVWEGVFPDRRDARILGVLPLPIHVHVRARLAALFAIAALLCVGVNLPAALIYGASIAVHGEAAGWGRGVLAHLTSTALGGLFVFFSLVAAQGALLTVFSRRLAQRLALVLQATFVVVLLQALLFVPYLRGIVRAAFRDGNLGAIAWLPPVWFLSLYDAIAGTARSVPASFVVAAVATPAAVIVISTVLFVGNYRRLVRMALETPDGRTRSHGRWRARLAGVIGRVLMPNPVQRAVSTFTLRTMAHSRMHLMMLAICVGVAAALILSTIIPVVVSGGLARLDTPGVTLLSAPLVLNFCALCGLRAMFGIPTDIKANWVFRLHAPADRMVAAIGGVRMAMLLAAVVPIAIAAGAIGVALWGIRIGLAHAVFTGALGTLLADVMLIGLRKVPFTCTYFPGRSRARTLWPIYGIAFSMYAYSGAALEAAMLDDPRAIAIVVGVIAVVVAALWFVRRRDLQPPASLIYDEQDPDSVFAGFRLSEGLAAESRTASTARRGGG